MTDSLILAYLAGAMDSDGCISVKRSTYAMRVRGDAGQPVYSERAMLKQVTRQIPEMLQGLFGGSLRLERKARGRDLWSWNATDLRAVECVQALLPYLVVKREQAINCLALRSLKEQSKVARVAVGRGHAGSAARSAEHSAAMEETYLRAKEMNSGARL